METESLSDYLYIFLSLLPAGSGEKNRKRRRGQRRHVNKNRGADSPHPRWAIKKLNRDLLLATAHAVAWAAPPEEVATRNAEREAEWFQTKMAEICNVAMSRAKYSSRDATYWWSPELGSKRTVSWPGESSSTPKEGTPGTR